MTAVTAAEPIHTYALITNTVRAAPAPSIPVTRASKPTRPCHVLVAAPKVVRVSRTVLLFLLAPALHAGQVRMEFIARAGGERVAGAAGCFFKAGVRPR